MSICTIKVYALVRELQALQRYGVEATHTDYGGCRTYETQEDEGDYIRASDFLAVMARNVIPEGSVP